MEFSTRILGSGFDASNFLFWLTVNLGCTAVVVAVARRKGTYSMNGTHGRNLTLAACCVVLCALCLFAAGRWEMERRENVKLRTELQQVRGRDYLVGEGYFAWDALADAAEREKMLRYGLTLKTREHEESKKEATLYRQAAEDLARKLKRYEAAYPEPNLIRRAELAD